MAAKGPTLEDTRALAAGAWSIKIDTMVTEMDSVVEATFKATKERFTPIITAFTVNATVHKQPIVQKADHRNHVEVILKVAISRNGKELLDDVNVGSIELRFDSLSPVCVELRTITLESADPAAEASINIILSHWFDIWRRHGMTFATIAAGCCNMYCRYFDICCNAACGAGTINCVILKKPKNKKEWRFKGVSIQSIHSDALKKMYRTRAATHRGKQEETAADEREEKEKERCMNELHAFAGALIKKKEKLKGRWMCISDMSYWRGRGLGRTINWKQDRVDDVVNFLRRNRRSSDVWPKSHGRRSFFGVDVYIVGKNCGIQVKDICKNNDWWTFFDKPEYATPGEDHTLTPSKSTSKPIKSTAKAKSIPTPASAITPPIPPLPPIPPIPPIQPIPLPILPIQPIQPISPSPSLKPNKKRKYDTTKRNNTHSILDARASHSRLQNLQNDFKELAKIRNETELAATALALAVSLFRDENTPASRKKAKRLASIGAGTDVEKEVADLCISAAIRSNLWQSTRAYASMAITLCRIFDREILPSLKKVREYELSDEMFPRNHNLQPRIQMFSEYKDALPLWPPEAGTPEMSKLFRLDTSGLFDCDWNWKKTTPEGTYFNTKYRQDLPDVYGFALHVKPMLENMVDQCVPEIELNLAAYMLACYNVTDPTTIERILSSSYTTTATVGKGIDGLGEMGEKTQIIGLGDHQLRACVKLPRLLCTPNWEVGKPPCGWCGNSGLSKERHIVPAKGSKKEHNGWKNGCCMCGRFVLFRVVQGNSSKTTPDVANVSGNEGNHTVYDIIFNHIEKDFDTLEEGHPFFLKLSTLGIQVEYGFDVVNTMFDFKALAGMVGVSHLGSGCMCLGGETKKGAKDELGPCQLLTLAERCELGLQYETYATYPYNGEHTKVSPLIKRGLLRNFISSTPNSTKDSVADSSHASIARGTMILNLLYRETAEVWVGTRSNMTSDQKELLDKAETVVDKWICVHFHRAVKMMHDGNLTRDLLNINNRNILLQVIPTAQRQRIVNAFLDGVTRIHETSRASNPEPGSWIGFTTWALGFAAWVRDNELGYLGWGMYFHHDICHTEAYQTRLGGLLGMCSAESQEAGNKEGRKIKRLKSRQNVNGHYDTVGARWLWTHRKMNERWFRYRKNQITTGECTLVPASNLKQVNICKI